MEEIAEVYARALFEVAKEHDALIGVTDDATHAPLLLLGGEVRREEEDLEVAVVLERLREAREQADEILVRARKAAENVQDETKAQAVQQREELLSQARRDIEHETRRALDELRKEVADMTVIATEKITRKSLDSEDHRRLIEEALGEVDFSALAGKEGNG